MTNIPSLPHIPDLQFRLLDSETDYSKLCDIYNLCAMLSNPDFFPQTPTALAAEMESMTCGQAQNMLIAEIDQVMVGWGHCFTYRQRRNLTIADHNFYLLPEWQGKGIELAALGYFENRIQELLPAQQARQAIYKLFVNDTENDRIALLQSAGYSQIAAHAIMVRPNLEHIPDYPLPPGIEIRPFSEQHLRQVYEAHRLAFIEHIHGNDASDEDFVEWSQDEDLSDRSLWVIAWDIKTNKIAGLILNYILHDQNSYNQRERAYIEYISVVPSYRRLGLARAMIAASLGKVKERGMQEAALSSHTENPFNPISLYIEMGFEVRYHTLVYSKPINKDYTGGS